MRRITFSILLAVMLVTFGAYATAMDIPQQQPRIEMKAMSVAELEIGGDQARGQKNYSLAIDYFQAALQKDRRNANLYNKLGLAQLKNNELNAAKTSFQKASKINSKYAEAINNIGAVEYMRKNYGGAAKYFKKAVALDETHSTYHVNLGAAWFSQKKFERAISEYVRALELNPDAFNQESKIGIAAQILSPEERAQYAFSLAKAYAKRGDVDNCLQCLKKAKEEGYRSMANVYKDEEFTHMRDNPRLHEVVPPPLDK
jgi:tetratricopeptide (TPR) repeat protein